MRYWTIFFIAAISLISVASAQTPIASPYTAFTDWIPIVVLAALLTWTMAGVYYMIGYLLSNNRIKGAAILELQQAAGSIVLLLIILAVMQLISSGTSGFTFAGLLGNNGTSDVSNICNIYLYNAKVSLLDTNPVATPQSDGASGSDPSSGLPQPTYAVCSYLINSDSSTPTGTIDYGLAATYVIIANMTNQTVAELNGIYNFESLLFFLRNINPLVGACEPVECVDPTVPRAGTIYLSYMPFGGYVLHRTILPTITTQGNLTLYAFIAQLGFITLILLTWPYLLAAGIILRTIPFTRRAGGFIVAATIAFVLIMPTIFLFEYSTLNHLAGDTFIGASQIPGISLCAYGSMPQTTPNQVLYCYTYANTLKTSYIYKQLALPSGMGTTLNACTNFGEAQNATDGTTLTDPFKQIPQCYVKRSLSFYVFPSSADIVRFYSCYPTGSSIIPEELQIVTYSVIQSGVLPVTALLSLFVNGFSLQSNPLSGLIGTFFAPAGTSCLSKLGPYNIIATINALLNMYGIITVSAFIVPIINFLMMLSAITGISSLIGGETTIIGLSRFL